MELLVATPTSAQPASWEPVDSPSPGAALNTFLDVSAKDGPLHALLFSKDSSAPAAPATYTLYQRTNSGWTTAGVPPQGPLDHPPQYNALAATPDGAVWMGGDVEWHPIINPRPAVVRWTDGGGWEPPEMIELMPMTVHPFTDRSGTIHAMDVASDGTVVVVGQAIGFGNALDTSLPLFLVNDGSGWTEVIDPTFNWPADGRDGTALFDVVAFSATNVWAVGRHGTGAGVGEGGILVHYDGSSLNLVEDPRETGLLIGHPLRGIDASGPSDVWAVGDGSVTGNTTGLVHYDGSEWTLVDSPAPSIRGADEVVVRPNGDAWASDLFAQTDAFRWMGTEWTLAPFLPSGTRDIRGMDVDGSGVVWAVGSTSDRTTSFAMRRSASGGSGIPVSTTDGWNLLSVPLDAPDPSFESVLPQCTNGFAFQPGTGYQSIAPTDPVPPGRGGFFRCTAGTTIVEGVLPSPPTVDVAQGWNLIGPFGTPVRADRITSAPSGIVQTSFFAFDDGYASADTLRPGRGYWVRVSQDGTLDLSGEGQAAARMSGMTEPEPVRSQTRLTITDADQKTSVLTLFRDASVSDLGRFALPPRPPAPAFDVRFASDRTAAIASATGTRAPSTVHSVRLQGLQPPIRIRMETTGLRLPPTVSLRSRSGPSVSLTGADPAATMPTAPARLQVVVQPSPRQSVLQPVRPHPAATIASIPYTVAQETRVRIDVFDVLGRRIAQVVDGRRQAGHYSASIDARRLPSATYFVRMRTDGRSMTQPMTVVQ